MLHALSSSALHEASLEVGRHHGLRDACQPRTVRRVTLCGMNDSVCRTSLSHSLLAAMFSQSYMERPSQTFQDTVPVGLELQHRVQQSVVDT